MWIEKNIKLSNKCKVITLYPIKMQIMKLVLQIIFLFLYSFVSVGQNKIYQKHKDSLVSMNKQLPQCVKKYPKNEVDCHKEYFHILKDMEKDMVTDIGTILKGERLKKFLKEEKLWTDTSYMYFSKTFIWFKNKYPNESALNPSN